jgi:hypothetical protein
LMKARSSFCVMSSDQLDDSSLAPIEGIGAVRMPANFLRIRGDRCVGACS